MIVQSFIVYRMRTVATLSFVTRRDNCLEPADRSAPSHVTRHVSRDTAALSLEVQTKVCEDFTITEKEGKEDIMLNRR